MKKILILFCLLGLTTSAYAVYKCCSLDSVALCGDECCTHKCDDEGKCTTCTGDGCCKDSTDCSDRTDGKTVCDTSSKVCACPSDKVWDASIPMCVECTQDSHCAGRSDGKKLCFSDHCVGCLRNSDCAGNIATGRTKCDVSNSLMCVCPSGLYEGCCAGAGIEKPGPNCRYACDNNSLKWVLFANPDGTKCCDIDSQCTSGYLCSSSTHKCCKGDNCCSGSKPQTGCPYTCTRETGTNTFNWVRDPSCCEDDSQCPSDQKCINHTCQGECTGDDCCKNISKPGANCSYNCQKDGTSYKWVKTDGLCCENTMDCSGRTDGRTTCTSNICSCPSGVWNSASSKCVECTDNSHCAGRSDGRTTCTSNVCNCPSGKEWNGLTCVTPQPTCTGDDCCKNISKPGTSCSYDCQQDGTSYKWIKTDSTCCEGDGECSGSTPYCLNKTCVECETSYDCLDPNFTECNRSTHRCTCPGNGVWNDHLRACAECNQHSDCPDRSCNIPEGKCVCTTNQVWDSILKKCRGACKNDNDCKYYTEKYCYNSQKCVRCIEHSHCPSGQKCDSFTHTCKVACSGEGCCTDPKPTGSCSYSCLSDGTWTKNDASCCEHDGECASGYYCADNHTCQKDEDTGNDNPDDEYHGCTTFRCYCAREGGKYCGKSCIPASGISSSKCCPDGYARSNSESCYHRNKSCGTNPGSSGTYGTHVCYICNENTGYHWVWNGGAHWWGTLYDHYIENCVHFP